MSPARVSRSPVRARLEFFRPPWGHGARRGGGGDRARDFQQPRRRRTAEGARPARPVARHPAPARAQPRGARGQGGSPRWPTAGVERDLPRRLHAAAVHFLRGPALAARAQHPPQPAPGVSRHGGAAAGVRVGSQGQRLYRAPRGQDARPRPDRRAARRGRCVARTPWRASRRASSPRSTRPIPRRSSG